MMKKPRNCKDDLTKYLHLIPEATDADAINATVKKLMANMTNWT